MKRRGFSWWMWRKGPSWVKQVSTDLQIHRDLIPSNLQQQLQGQRGPASRWTWGKNDGFVIFCYCWDKTGEKKRHFISSFLDKGLPLAVSVTGPSYRAAATRPRARLPAGWGFGGGGPVPLPLPLPLPLPVITVDDNMETSCFYLCFLAFLFSCFDSSAVWLSLSSSVDLWPLHRQCCLLCFGAPWWTIPVFTSKSDDEPTRPHCGML